MTTKYWPTHPISQQDGKWNFERLITEPPDLIYPENFAYINNNVLFIGINLVGGVIHNQTEWTNRQNANIKWIDYQFDKYCSRSFNNTYDCAAMVILGHSHPDIQTNDPFFNDLFSLIPFKYIQNQRSNPIQVVYIHRNLGINTWNIHPNYNNISPLFTVIEVEGSIWPPMKININLTTTITNNTRGTNERFVTLNGTQNISWYNEYLTNETTN